jgi:hypothetical protein
MLKIWDAANFRRTVGGLCLILAPLVNFAGELTFPSAPGDNYTASAYLTIATQQHDRLVVAVYIQIVWAILFIPAFFALLHVIRGRGVVMVHVGVILALVGAALSGLVLAGFYITVAIMGSPGLDSAAMTALLQKVLNDPVGAPILLGFSFAGIGLLLIWLAVWRSRFAYRWVGPLMCIAVVADYINPLHYEMVTATLGALLVIGPAAIGYRILTMSDAQWESGEAAVAHPTAAMAS